MTKNKKIGGADKAQGESSNSAQEPPKAQTEQPSTSKSSTHQQRQTQKTPWKGKGQYENDWNCSNCNVSNYANKVECRKCHAPKPTSAPREQRPKTKFEQQPSTSKSSTQPLEQQLKQEQTKLTSETSQVKNINKEKDAKEKKLAPGDWICSQCNTHNFAKKKDCKKCKAPQPKVDPIKEMPLDQQQQQQRASGSQQDIAAANVQTAESLESSFKEMKIPTKKTQTSLLSIESKPDGKIYEGSRGKNCKVEVNYTTIKFDMKKLPKVAYHYDVSFDPESPKKLIPIALQTFMANHFPSDIFAFDGRKNVYTKNKLLKDENDVFEKEVEARLLDRSKMFKVKIKLATVVDLSVLLNYRNPQFYDQDKPSQAIQVLDVILRSAFRENLLQNRAVQAGRGLYFPPNGPNNMSLGEGMELWLGLFQSAIMGRASIYLNVDVLHKAFPSSIPILELLKTFNRDGRMPTSLRDFEQNQLKEYLAMLSVGYRISPNDPIKTYGFNGLVESASRARFDDNGTMITVQQYFRTTKGITLRYPDLPCLWVGSRVRNIYLPIEFCEIPAGQATNKKCTPNCVANIIKFSATSTDERKRKIMDLLNKISYTRDPTVSGFGIDVDKNFQNIDARVINPPNLKYKNSVVQVRGGVWREDKFIETEPEEIKWCIINYDHQRTNIQALTAFKDNMLREARSQNLKLMNMSASEIQTYDIRDIHRVRDVLQKCKQLAYKLVVVVVIERNDCYAKVKQAAELEVGILTQCIKANTIYRMGRGNPMMTIKNILLKLNAKLDGKNHEIQEMSYQQLNKIDSSIMFVGADVTHPSPQDKFIPSVVGVASSHDQVGFRYCCAWRLQDPKKEMIVDLENIITEHLLFYKRKNKKLPAKILYYRDGVSDGQFKEVLSIEMSAIEKAMIRAYGPKNDKNPHAEVTFVVVQKRHHTRFFPIEPNFTDGKFRNVVPGTIVDKNIVHPFQYQFFMVSHAAIQGVSKPTKYCILVNQSNIKPDDLQAITYDLCHLFTRCNRSVSYPAPTYYAHLVAARGKNYIIGQKLDMNNLQREYNRRNIQPDIINRTPMFFV